MVRFKVIKGSQLLFYAAIVILALVVGGIAISLAFSNEKQTAGAQASLVQTENVPVDEAETDSVFASFSLDQKLLPLDPGEEGGLSIEILTEATPPAVDAPSVLIYHTHTHEAYEQVMDDRYVAIEAWRTTDEDHSVVRVGEELTALLRECGFEVVHDTTDHEQSDLKTAYTRSLDTLESYERSFDLYIDLHRDAYIEGMEDEAVYDGEQRLAQLMLLIGNGEGFNVKPYYEENLAFAKALTERVNQLKPALCKDVLVKDGRYNQNIGVFSILVEVGHNRNTLREALSSLPYLAEALRSLMIDQPDPALKQLQADYFAAR